MYILVLCYMFQKEKGNSLLWIERRICISALVNKKFDCLQFSFSFSFFFLFFTWTLLLTAFDVCWHLLINMVCFPSKNFNFKLKTLMVVIRFLPIETVLPWSDAVVIPFEAILEIKWANVNKFEKNSIWHYCYCDLWFVSSETPIMKFLFLYECKKHTKKGGGKNINLSVIICV